MSENTVQKPRPVCLKQPCEMTGGYYIGGGLYVCWMHAIADAELFDLCAGKALVALIPSEAK